MRGGFFMASRVANEKISTNKYKGKKFSPAFQRWREPRGRSLLVVLAAVVNYVYLRNPFAKGLND